MEGERGIKAPVVILCLGKLERRKKREGKKGQLEKIPCEINDSCKVISFN